MLLYKGINRFSDVGGDGVYVARGIDNNDVFAVLEQLKRAVIPLAYCVHLLRIALENFEIHAPVLYSLVAAVRVYIEENSDVRLDYSGAVEVHVNDPLLVLAHRLICY